MLYERLVAQARTGDGLDEIRLGAIEQVRWLPDLLDRQRRNRQASRIERHEEITAAAHLIRAQMCERLGSCREDERRAAAIILMPAADFTDESILRQIKRGV